MCLKFCYIKHSNSHVYVPMAYKLLELHDEYWKIGNILTDITVLYFDIWLINTYLMTES
jgi:hypothetical protein